jgi:lipoate-protein ligase A
LRAEKYATWEWNYGFSPVFDLKKERKFSTGLVTVYLRVENGCIQEIHIYGDFFGNGEIADLERALVGAPLGEALAQRLEACDVGYYMSGITGADLYELILY